MGYEDLKENLDGVTSFFLEEKLYFLPPSPGY